MSLDFIIAFLLLITGIAVALLFAQPIWKIIVSLIKSKLKFDRFSKAKRQLLKIDALIREDDFHQAGHLLITSINLNSPKSLDLLQEIEKEHKLITSRMLIVLEESSENISTVTQIEKLLNQRSTLDRAMLSAKESFQRLKSKRQSAGKSTASWSKAEYQNKIKEISDQLLQNEKEVLLALQKFHDEVCHGHDDEEVTYH